MGRDADIVVVGAGITGVATARSLAQSGRGVVLVEQFALGHDRGSSHGASRIFRLSYPDAHYVRLAQGALQSWRELESEVGEELIVRTGGLDFGPVAVENARALASCGVSHELLSGADVAARWPISAEAVETVLFHADGGVILADRGYQALLTSAVEAGAVVARRAARDRDRARPRLGAGEHRRRRDHCRGMRRRGGRLGPSAARWRGDRAPGRPHVRDGRVLPPPRPDEPAAGDRRCRPGRRGARPAPARTDQLRARGARRRASRQGSTIPGHRRTRRDGAGPIPRSSAGSRPGPRDDTPGSTRSRLATETCLYTNTADESFVLERHGRIVVASACSGHGFKFAPAFGRTLAALARDAAG